LRALQFAIGRYLLTPTAIETALVGVDGTTKDKRHFLRSYYLLSLEASQKAVCSVATGRIRKPSPQPNQAQKKLMDEYTT
jgi:hypothetical protein